MINLDCKFLLESILGSLDEGVIVVDNKANITFYNEPASNISGVECDDIIGKNVLEVFRGLCTNTSTFYEVLETKKPIIEHIQTYTNYSGKKVQTVTTTLPLIENGEMVGALEIYRSFTDVKKLKNKIDTLEKELYVMNLNKKGKFLNGTTYTLNDIISKSEKMEILKTKAIKVADSCSTIMIVGETGTGKELLAQGIHNAGYKRRNKPFIAQNCAAIPRNLLESLMFGTTEGCFTGAKEKPGIFELADGGTLFLDEINSMDIELQSKLLRVLQESSLRRIGGKKEIKVDVRVIAATNVDPLTAIEESNLREDLYYRLNIIQLNIPKLSERNEDISVLVNYCIDEFNKKLGKNVSMMTESCVEILEGYNWPGNIRQLKGMIESIFNFIEKDVIEIDDLPVAIIQNSKKSQTEKANEPININGEIPPLKSSVELYEKNIIIKALRKSNYNCSEAARLLKIPKQTLHNKIKKYNIECIYNIS